MSKAAHRSHAAPDAERLEGIVLPEIIEAPNSLGSSGTRLPYEIHNGMLTPLERVILAAIPQGGCTMSTLVAAVGRDASQIRSRLGMFKARGLIRVVPQPGQPNHSWYQLAEDESQPQRRRHVAMLALLADAPDSTLPELAARIGTVPGGAAYYRIRDALKTGWVSRRRDLRTWRYSLTTAGRRVLQEEKSGCKP